MSKVTLGILVVLGMITGVILVVNKDPIGRAIGPSCTVGMQSMSATITAKGWGSGSYCQNFLKTAGSKDYGSGPPKGDVLCHETIDGNDVSVHDMSTDHVGGRVLCNGLAIKAGHSGTNMAGPTPTPLPLFPTIAP